MNVKHNPDIPYYPGNVRLDLHTLSPSGIHYGNVTEYDVHTLGGHLEIIATNKFLKENLG